MNSLCVLDILFESCICFSCFPSLILSYLMICFSFLLWLYPGPTWKEDVRLPQLILCQAGQQLARLCWEQSSFSSAHRSPWELLPVETLVLSIVRGSPYLFPAHLLSMPLLNLYPPWASFLAVKSPLPTFGVLCPVLLLFCMNEWDWGSLPSRMFSGLKHSCDPLSNSGECFRWDRYPKEIILSGRE